MKPEYKYFFMELRNKKRSKIQNTKFIDLSDTQKEYFLHLLKSKDDSIIIALIKQGLTLFEIFMYFGYNDIRSKAIVSRIFNIYNQVKDVQKLLEFKSKLKMIMFPEKLKVSEKINEGHFFGKFIFPNDLDFLGCSTDCQIFVDWFNEMIEKRK